MRKGNRANADNQQICHKTSKYVIKPLDEWFDALRFMILLEPWINCMDIMGRWEAFSYDGIIYCRHDFLYEIGRRLCLSAKALDRVFMIKSKKEVAKNLIVDALWEAYFVSDILPADLYAMEFTVLSDAGTKEYKLIPLKWDSFIFDAIDRRKSGLMSSIRVVS